MSFDKIIFSFFKQFIGKITQTVTDAKQCLVLAVKWVKIENNSYENTRKVKVSVREC